VIGLIVAVTSFFAWQATGVELNNSIEAVLPAGHPALLQDHEIKQVFNSRELILIGLLNADGVFNPHTLQKVRDLTTEIWALSVSTEEDERELRAWGERLGEPFQASIRALLQSGIDITDRGRANNLWLEVRDPVAIPDDFRAFVEELRLKLSPVSDVLSLAQVDNITATEAGLEVAPPMDTVPQSEEELATLAATVFENEMFVNGLVSEDTTGTVILVELSFYYDDHLDLAHDLFQELEALAAPYAGPEDVRVAGVPMVNVYTSNYMGGDLRRLMPLVILAVLGVMYLSFGTAKGALIPVAVVLVALVWTLGVMAMLGRPITLVVSAMPIILIAIGVADGIHIITEYQLMWPLHRDRDEAILATMRAMNRPIIFTSLTDVAGFGSLAISSLVSIRDFGIFTSVGVLAALIFSLTFIPAALKLMKPPQGRALVTGDGRITGLLEQLGRFALQRRRWLVAGTVAMAALAALTLPRINVGSRMVGYFQEDSEIYQASQMINSKFGGTEVLNVVVDTGRPDGLKDPETLGKIALLQDTLEARALVGYTTSVADYVKRIHLVMNDNDPAYNRVPTKTERVRESDWIEVGGVEVEVVREVDVSGRDLIAQYLLLYENAGGDDIEKLADFEYAKANIVAQIRTDHTPMLREIRQVAQDFATREFGEDAEVSFAGCSNLCIVGDELIIPSQLKSLALALVVVFGLLVLIYRSVRYGLIGMLPLALTVLVVFALLSLFGIYLDAITALVASIVLGIGIDYSVHFLSRYRALRQEGSPVEDAVRETMRTSGRAILFNSLAVALGFLVLLLSSFWPVMHIGWMVAANMLIAAALTLVLVPAVLSRGSTH
jgi:predicted RND superfamily exporter protein